MKQNLAPSDRIALINYRLQRASETIVEADYNACGNYFNSAINRLYYAAYYSASALMLTYGYDCSTHAGIKSLLALKFIKPGLLDAVHGKTFMALLENRQSGDYEDFVYCDKEMYELLRPRTVDFISAMSMLITKYLQTE